MAGVIQLKYIALCALYTERSSICKIKTLPSVSIFAFSISRSACSFARNNWEWTGSGTWHRSHLPAKERFHSSSAIYGATCSSELREFCNDAVLSKQVV